MPRPPVPCRVHGLGPTRWRVNGSAGQRERVCAICHPGARPLAALRAMLGPRCGRCGAKRAATYTPCRPCQARHQRGYYARHRHEVLGRYHRRRIEAGREECPDGVPCPYVTNAEALTAALGRDLSPPARVSLAGADWRTELFPARAALAGMDGRTA